MRNKFILLAIFFSFSLAPLLTYEQSTFTTIEDRTSLHILTPSFQDRKTAKIQLENGLQAYLISDPLADQSAATLVVGTGTWEDPAEHPGIAHFLEHMLFMGTKKYPDESEYMRFISEHGGKTNAFTSSEKTGYLFSVNNNALPEALDRFANFFIDPLFNPSSVDRELQAIDQEYAKNIEDDFRREFFVLKALADPANPFHAFGSGNKKTLQNVSQETLKTWYRDHYSANRMRLEVISPLPIDELKSLVVDTFTAIPNKNLPPIEVKAPIIPESMKGKMVYIEPLKNMRRITINWELPKEFIGMRDIQPELIVRHILEHQGPNGLLAQLKREGLGENIEAGGEKVGSSNVLFFLSVDLTDAGVKDIHTVIRRCFEAIENMKKQGIPYYIFEEINTMDKLRYQFPSRQDAFDHMMDEAFSLTKEPMETYPEQTYVLAKFDPALIQSLLSNLSPQNAVYDLIAPKQLLENVNFDQHEQWLGVHYAVADIPQETIDMWKAVNPNPQIQLPAPNRYIPSNSTLIFLEKKENLPFIPTPISLVNNDRANILFAQDDRFGIPKVTWLFEIRTPSITPGNAESYVLRDLFVRYASEVLRPYTYSAGLAGLEFSILPAENGLFISIEGFSDKAGELFNDLVREIRGIRLNNAEFQELKDRLSRSYENHSYGTPLSEGHELLTGIQNKHHVSARTKRGAIDKVDFTHMQNFVDHLFDKTYIEGIFYGNLNEQQARRLTGQLLETIDSEPYPKDEHQEKDATLLEQEQGPFHVEAKSYSQGNALILAVQVDDTSAKAWAAQKVLMQAIDRPFFAELRTKQQTGYIVFSEAKECEKCLFNTFAVQSNTHDGRDLLVRFENFIEGFLQDMAADGVTPERFNNIKRGLLSSLKQPPQNMSDMAFTLLDLATDSKTADKIDERIKALENLSYDEFIEKAQKMLGKDNSRRLAVIVSGHIPAEG